MDSARTRRTWARQAGYAAASLGAIGAFLAIGRTIHQSRGNSFDKAVMGFMGRARRSPLTAAVRAVTFFGSVPGAVAVSLAACYAARKHPRRVAQIGVGALGGIAAELGIKRLFRRVRPDMLQHLERVRSTSFPSGHSMASSSLYLTLALVGTRSEWIRPYRVPIIVGAGAFAAGIGATRVYLGVHWPTDVLGGLALGTAWACATEALFDWARAEELSPTPATT
jgi:membrane-associated phospholipid phosphatase